MYMGMLENVNFQIPDNPAFVKTRSIIDMYIYCGKQQFLRINKHFQSYIITWLHMTNTFWKFQSLLQSIAGLEICMLLTKCHLHMVIYVSVVAQMWAAKWPSGGLLEAGLP